MSANFINQPEVFTRGLEIFANIIHDLTHTKDISDPLRKCVDSIPNIIETADACAILFWDPPDGLLQPFAVFGYEPEPFLTLGLRPGEGLPGKVFKEGKPRFCETPESCAVELDDLSPTNQRKWVDSYHTQTRPHNILAVPISRDGNQYGVVILENWEKAYAFSQQDRTYAQIIGDIIALAMAGIRPEQPGTSQTQKQNKYHLEMEWVETLSHELRMPLTAIKGYATALLLDEVHWGMDKRQEFLEMIEEECDQMEYLLADLLNAALVDVNQLPLEMQEASLPGIARDISEEMVRRSDNHRILFDFPDDYPHIQADVRWMKQVFRNLFDNAVKYSPEGGLIYIHGEVREGDVVVRISDPGIGIPPEDLIPIFEKPVPSQTITDAPVPNSGLGLPITRAIVEAHGGRVWAQSDVGQGTTISFSLPSSEDTSLTGRQK